MFYLLNNKEKQERNETLRNLLWSEKKNEDINKYIFPEATSDEKLFNLKLTSGFLLVKDDKNIFHIKFCLKISLSHQTKLKNDL